MNTDEQAPKRQHEAALGGVFYWIDRAVIYAKERPSKDNRTVLTLVHSVEEASSRGSEAESRNR